MKTNFFETEITYRVCYADTDQMKYVYHANYLRFFEIGRVEAIRSLGITYKDMESAGVMMPVMQLDIKFIRPAFYDDLITIKTMLHNYPENKLELIFHQEIYNENNKLLTKATIQLCYIDASNYKRIEIPPILHNIFEKIKIQ